MDQQQMDGAFRPNRHLNLLEDLHLGRNLNFHLEKIQIALEAVEYIIDEDGYLHPGINDNLDMKAYFKRVDGHLRKAIIDPNHRPAPEVTNNTDCDN